MSEPPHSQTGLRTALGDIIGDPVLVSGTWYDCQPLDHLATVGTTGGIWRWRGRMMQREGGLDWSIIQKRLTLGTRSPLWPGEPNPEDWGYWRREADALRSPLLSDLGPHLRRPRCHAVVEVEADIDLWTEDVGEPLATAPSVPRLGAALRALGEWQGRYLTGDLGLTDDGFLCRDFLRHYRSLRSELPPISPAWWRLPLARRHFERSWATAVEQIETAAPSLLALLDRLPRALNHNDVWPRNLFEVGGDTVAIDWAYVGPGACGEDAGNLIPDSIFDVILDADQADTLYSDGVDEYLGGLAAAGWEGDERLIRLGIAILGALKYTWILPYTLRSIAGDSMERAAARLGHAADVVAAARAAGLQLSLRMGEDALRLAHEVNVD